jgi:AcrR family transcriptional regulator
MDDVSSGRRVRAPLSVERVVDEAVALADQDGIAALSMRKLADRLGVEPMSLYHHLPNKDAILDAMVDRVFAEIAAPSADVPWTTAVRERCDSARGAMRRHPWSVGLMETRLTPGPHTLRHHDAMLGCLRHAGFDLALAGHAFSAIDSYLYGFVMQELALPFRTPEETAAMATVFLDHFPAAEFPHLAEFTTGHVLRPGYDFGDEFGFGLDLVLDGLERARSDQQDG